jgi:hypothetical protein
MIRPLPAPAPESGHVAGALPGAREAPATPSARTPAAGRRPPCLEAGA